MSLVKHGKADIIQRDYCDGYREDCNGIFQQGMMLSSILNTARESGTLQPRSKVGVSG